MKPPYLKKLSLKDLRKAYTHQWRLNIQVVTENFQLGDIIQNQEQEILVKSTLLTEHFAEIQNLKQLLAHEQKKRTEAELLNVDLEEALSRSRQLRKSFQEVADRKTGEKASIDDMAKNLLVRLCEQEVRISKEIAVDLGLEIELIEHTTWEQLTEEERDDLRVAVTHIISHQPTDGKPEGTTLDEGSAG